MLETLKNKTKYGFSLFEVVVTMSIVAIFIAACSNVFTQKHKKRVSSPTHGRYECYRNAAGTVNYRLFNESVLADSGTVASGTCRFTPPKYASYVVINAVGAGGYGGTATGGSSGSYANMFLSTTDHILELTPGTAAANATVARGGATLVIDKGKAGTDNRTILNLSGGKSDSAASPSFRDCTFANVAYSCGYDPTCTIKESDKVIEVTYCTAHDGSGIYNPGNPLLRTVKIPFTGTSSDNFDDNCNSSISFPESKQIPSVLSTYSGEDLKELAKGLITYDYTKKKCTTPSTTDPHEVLTFFTINLGVEGNYEETRDDSPLNGYVNALNINEGIATRDTNGNFISTGDGGAKNQKGGHGSVLITW